MDLQVAAAAVSSARIPKLADGHFAVCCSKRAVLIFLSIALFVQRASKDLNSNLTVAEAFGQCGWANQKFSRFRVNLPRSGMSRGLS